jgi:hypothetical protein
MTILADCSFIHLIIPKNQSVSTPIKPIIDYKQDLFIYITTKHYTPKEFYSIIIDTDTFKKSTIDYKQYLTYKTTIDNNTNINII